MGQTRARVVDESQEKFEQVKIRLERMRVDDSRWDGVYASFRPNKSESLNSQQLSSSFGQGFTEGW